VSLEGRIEKRFAALEQRIEDALHEFAQDRRIDHLEKTVEQLVEWALRVERQLASLRQHDREDDREIEHLEREVNRLKRLLRPHHYPRTVAVTVKPA
jgi:hypothetical protein